MLVELAEHAYGEADAWEGLVSFMERAAEMMAGDRGLQQMLMFAANGHNRVSYARDRMRLAVGRLVERAQATGQVRADLAATDIPVIQFILSVTAEYTHDVRPGIWRRYLALWLDAFQPARESYTPLPVPELTVEEFATVMRTSPLGRHRAPVSKTRSSPSRPPRSSPPPAEIVDNLLCLLMANLDKFIVKAPTLPLNYYRGKYPAKILSECLVTETPICFQAPHKPIWVVDRACAAYDCVICDLIRHQ